MEEVNTRSTTNNTKPTASKSEVISSTKVIIDAAKSAFGNDKENIDKAKVADAAADLLEFTSHYGKLEDKSYGKYINKAEDYLHHYNSSHSSASAATGHDGGGKEHGGGGGYGEYVKMAQGFMGNKHGGHDDVHGNEEHGKDNKTHDHEHVKNDDIHHGGGGGGEHGHNNEHSSGGGYGEYVKFAQGILKK